MWGIMFSGIGWLLFEVWMLYFLDMVKGWIGVILIGIMCLVEFMVVDVGMGILVCVGLNLLCWGRVYVLFEE